MSDRARTLKHTTNGEPFYVWERKPRLHQSIAIELLRSPLHGWHRAFGQEPEEYSEVTTRGQIAHSLLLGGSKVCVIEAPDWRTKAAKEAREEARAKGLLPILEPKMRDVEALMTATRLNLKARGIELAGETEANFKWTNRMGVDCEGTLDHVDITGNRGVIHDFKFTEDATRRACEGKFIAYGYDIQHQAYTEAVETLYPDIAGRIEMTYVFQEVNPPYAMRVMPLAGSMRTCGRLRWNDACQIWTDCLEQYGVEKPWPGYPDDEQPAVCPAWVIDARIQEQVMAEGGNL